MIVCVKQLQAMQACIAVSHALPWFGTVCCQRVTTSIPQIPTILKNSNNLTKCNISILLWKYRISDQGQRCKETPLSYKWVTRRHYLWQPYCFMAAIVQTSEYFDFLWNKIRILKVHCISFIPKIIFWLSDTILRQRVVVQYSPWQPYWKQLNNTC